MNSSSFLPLTKTLVELPSIIDNLLLLLSDKEKDVVSKRFVLNGHKRHTLDEIGKEFSVTRERVRQIEKNALSKMKRNVFNTALRDVHEFAADCVKKNGGFSREDSLIDSFSECVSPGMTLQKSNLHLAFALHDGFKCVGNTINFFPYVIDKNLPEYSLKHASNHLINQLQKYGDVKKLERLHSDLEKVFAELNFDKTKVKSLISIDKRVALLDDDFVGLIEWRHVNPRTLRDKILYVFRQEKAPLHFNEISKKISSAAFDKRSINVQAVHNELIRHDQFVLIGRGIYALAEWGYEKGTVSKVIERLLSEAKELSQEKIIELVLKQRRVKEITIVLALKNNTNFERVGRKRYKLKIA